MRSHVWTTATVSFEFAYSALHVLGYCAVGNKKKINQINNGERYANGLAYSSQWPPVHCWGMIHLSLRSANHAADKKTWHFSNHHAKTKGNRHPELTCGTGFELNILPRAPVKNRLSLKSITARLSSEVQNIRKERLPKELILFGRSYSVYQHRKKRTNGNRNHYQTYSAICCTAKHDKLNATFISIVLTAHAVGDAINVT